VWWEEEEEAGDRIGRRDARWAEVPPGFLPELAEEHYLRTSTM